MEPPTMIHRRPKAAGASDSTDAGTKGESKRDQPDGMHPLDIGEGDAPRGVKAAKARRRAYVDGLTGVPVSPSLGAGFSSTFGGAAASAGEVRSPASAQTQGFIPTSPNFSTAGPASYGGYSFNGNSGYGTVPGVNDYGSGGSRRGSADMFYSQTQYDLDPASDHEPVWTESVRSAIGAFRNGVRDMVRVDRSWGLVWGDPELRSRVLKVTLINLLSLTLLAIFPFVLGPLLDHSRAAHDRVEERKAEVGFWYNVLLNWPLFAVCFWVNALWGPDVARRAQHLLHPSYRHQPNGSMSGHLPPAPAFGSAAWAWGTATRLLFISELTFEGRALAAIPVVGRLVGLAYMCLINAYYSFEWIFAAKQAPLDYRCSYISDRAAYMFGFGLPATLLSSFGTPLINMAVFALIYPFLLIQALQARPPSPHTGSAGSLLASHTPSPSPSGPSTPTSENGFSFSPVSGSRSYTSTSAYPRPQGVTFKIGEVAIRIPFRPRVPLFFLARRALAGLRWLAAAIERDRGGSLRDRSDRYRSGTGTGGWGSGKKLY